MSNWHPDRFAEAWNFATHYHQGQTYGGAAEGQKIPYINHVASVAIEAMWGLATAPELDGNLAIQCALLHDTIEDTNATYDLILENFGRSVADGVMALTKDSNLPKSEQLPDSLSRIQQQPIEVWLAKMADRIVNLHHPPYYWTREKIANYRQEAIAIYDALHPANLAIANRLKDKIEQYQLFLQVVSFNL
jgi:(p)ppGpp synthase/HD superfamily hydrolase